MLKNLPLFISPLALKFTLIYKSTDCLYIDTTIYKEITKILHNALKHVHGNSLWKIFLLNKGGCYSREYLKNYNEFNSEVSLGQYFPSYRYQTCHKSY